MRLLGNLVIDDVGQELRKADAAPCDCSGLGGVWAWRQPRLFPWDLLTVVECKAHLL